MFAEAMLMVLKKSFPCRHEPNSWQSSLSLMVVLEPATKKLQGSLKSCVDQSMVHYFQSIRARALCLPLTTAMSNREMGTLKSAAKALKSKMHNSYLIPGSFVKLALYTIGSQQGLQLAQNFDTIIMRIRK